MTVAELPKELQEFVKGLGSATKSPDLLEKLLNLPENGLRIQICEHKQMADKAIDLHNQARKATEAAYAFALSIFNTAVKNWTLEEMLDAIEDG